MSAEQRPGDDSPDAESASDNDPSISDDDAPLAARIEILEAENRRLREAYAQTRRTEYRRAALALVGVGLLAVLGAALWTSARTVLLAIGATGVFVGLLTYYLTPERFIAASVGDDVYAALADTGARLVAELGLSDRRLYVPRPEVGDVRLFVPRRADADVPTPSALADLFVVTDDDRTRGIALTPTGDGLVTAFERALTGELAARPAEFAPQLTDGLVEQFELAATADPEVDAAGDRLSVAVADSPYAPLDRFDNPVASFLGAGTALATGEPVAVEVDPGERNGIDAVVTCRWDVAENATPERRAPNPSSASDEQRGESRRSERVAEATDSERQQ